MFEGDVDAIYEDRLMLSDLDIEGFDDMGDDPEYVFGGDRHPTDIVQCERCERTMRWMDSHGYGTDDVFCLSCWDRELKSQQP